MVEKGELRAVKWIFKKMIAIILSLCLVFIGYVVLSVQYWTMNEVGPLPVKTAVILHAINNGIITSDMRPPRFLVKPSPPTIAKEDILIPVSGGEQIQGRVYYPKKDGPHPIILYFHGGAFMEGFGNIDTHDNVIRALANRTNSVVVAVNYRLAPDYVFPTAVEDCYDTLKWAFDNGAIYNGDPSRLAVAGDSAGGNLATAVAIMTRDKKGPELKAQILLYPLTTFQEIPLHSRDLYDSGYFLLSRSVMYRARDLYTPLEEMWLSPYTSPLHAEDLRDLPPALIITAEYDPLKDEGKQYADRLTKEGVSVSHLHYEGVMHGFISFYEVMQMGEHGLGEATRFLTNHLSDTTPIYERKVIENLERKLKWRDSIEAYAIAVFLIYKSYFG